MYLRLVPTTTITIITTGTARPTKLLIWTLLGACFQNNLTKRNNLPSKCATKNSLQELTFTLSIPKTNNVAPPAHGTLKTMPISFNALLGKNFEMKS